MKVHYSFPVIKPMLIYKSLNYSILTGDKNKKNSIKILHGIEYYTFFEISLLHKIMRFDIFF